MLILWTSNCEVNSACATQYRNVGEKSAPSVERLDSQVHKLAKCQRNSLVRRSIEGRHLVHNTLGVVPVSNSE